MKSVIIGGASTKMCQNSGASAADLYLEAIKLALEDSRIELAEVDGMITGSSFVELQFMYTSFIAERLGLKLRWAGSVDAGGANSISALILADMAIRTRKASAIIVADADNVGTFYKQNSSEFFKKACQGMNNPDPEFRDPAKPIVALMYNAVTEWYAKKFIAKYGELNKKVLRMALSEVAIAMSKHASKNPLALNQKILTRKDVLESGRVASWLARYECARPADGGGAIIVVSEKKAKALKLTNNSVRILGSGQSFDHKNLIDFESDWGCKKAGREAFEEAGITIEDIETAFLYDCFPITVFKALEDLNFCGELEAPFYVLGGNLELGKSRCPINTHGGLLSGGAPWAAASILGSVEIIKQLQDKAGLRQVPNCRIALAYGNGGCFSASSVVILGK